MENQFLEPPKRKNLKRCRSRMKPKNMSIICDNAAGSANSSSLPENNFPQVRVRALTNIMPVKEDCVFWWTTVAAVRIRTLFEAAKNIISEGVLVVSSETIVLQEYDNTRVMVVYLRMRSENLDQYGAYYCPNKLCIPLSIDEFYKGVKCINQSDVVGLCITKKSMESSYPSLDLHIMHPTHGYSYKHSCRMLHEEFMHADEVHLRDDAKFYAHITIKATFFKRYLNDCVPHGKNLQFLFRYDKIVDEYCVFLIPCDSVISMSRMTLRLTCDNTEGLDADQIEQLSEETAPKYSIANLLLFTKATPLSNTVEILLSHEFPLVVKYGIGDLGEIRFCLAPVFSDQERDAYLDQVETVEPKPTDSADSWHSLRTLATVQETGPNSSLNHPLQKKQPYRDDPDLEMSLGAIDEGGDAEDDDGGDEDEQMVDLGVEEVETVERPDFDESLW